MDFSALADIFTVFCYNRFTMECKAEKKAPRCVGVIAEYNPFHKGHALHLVQSRAAGFSAVVVAMSGDFVQRGEAALYSKYLRAKHALENGADMVLQLSAAFSLASAQRFARGGVNILAQSGVVDAISFGSESGDPGKLRQAARAADDADPAFQERLRAQLDAGLSYPAAVAKAAQWEDEAPGPNDLLAMEYLRSMEGTNLEPICIRREGALHDAEKPEGAYASASALRAMLCAGRHGEAAPFLPPGTARDLQNAPPYCGEALGPLVLYALRRMDIAELAALPDVGEGLENVIHRACRAQTDYEGFLFACKSKRYTLSRLRRIAMAALLGIRREDVSLRPYIRVLGIRREAQALLSALCANSALPVIIRARDAETLPAPCRRLFELDLRAAEIAAFAAGKSADFDLGIPLLRV